MYLNLETTKKKNGLHLEAVQQRAPFTLRVSAEWGSSINREPVRVTRAVFVFQALDDTEIIGYRSRDSFSFKALGFSRKEAFSVRVFHKFLLSAGGAGRIAFVNLAFTQLPCYMKDENQLTFRDVLEKGNNVALKYAHRPTTSALFLYRFIVPVKTTEDPTMMICVLGRQQLYQHLKFY